MNNRIGLRLLSLAVFSVACNLPALAGDPGDLPRKFADSRPQPSELAAYVQSWTGVFGERKIGVFIESLTATQIRGYSMVGQNKRPFQGTVRQQNGVYLVTAREPMTQASDGVFQLRLDPTSPRQIQGTWRSGQAKVAPKTFSLTPRACTASKTAGDYDGSVRSLTGDELQTDPWTLATMRNEIYARHGYAFADREVAAEFAEKDWYIPCSSNVEAKLSSLERANIQKLRKAEIYAKTRDWGR
jgi:hypothetical protein